jgi:hypothetical protein
MYIKAFLDHWYLRTRFLNDPATLYLHFCYYLPFDEGLSLYLNKLEFPLCKDNLHQF